MGHSFKHFILITKHRHKVIRNASHCGIFFHSLTHDLSKYGPTEFWTSAKYYAGNMSPIVNERRNNDYFSTVCQHHAKHNKHHWEYWCDWAKGNVIIMTMPWKYATEYVCDMLSASYTYAKKDFKPETALNYFNEHVGFFHMTKATQEYIRWCLTRYRDMGWKGLRKKDTKAKYAEITSNNKRVEYILLEGAGELSF